MSIDLTGITNKNEYYTNHYFSTAFEENTSATISDWNAAARESEEIKTPWSLLRQNARQYYTAHDKFVRSSVNLQVLANIKALAGSYLKSLGYPEAKPEVVSVDDSLSVPVYLEMTKSNGAPLLWVLLSASKESDAGIMESFVFNADDVDDDAAGTLYKGILGEMANEDLVTKILFGTAEPPRFIILIGMNQIALIDRNKWNEKRYLQFELEEIFSRLENTTLQAMSVLLHKDSLCPDDGKVLLDELDEQSQKNASGVSQDLKYALRECIELLGNEVLYDMKTRLGRDLDADPVDAGQLTLECLRYMYRMLFVLFIESRPELGYAPIKAQSYYSGYSLESLRDIADNIRDDVNEVGDGYYLHETLAKLYELIYDGYPKTEDELKKATGSDSLHDMFLIAPLKAHIFDPEYTKMITAAKLRNSCMLRIIDLMSLTRATGRKNGRRGRISYANLGINQMGAVYEALLSYRGFIAEHDLYEVKRAGDSFNELDVGYFVSESELDQYTEDERVRYESGEKAGKLRMYEKGTFIYRLAGREREKSASYYTPEVLTRCLVKYALKELLEGKTADEVLKLTICEPAMGSAAFLNEAINQLAEAYISRKEKETGEIISYEKRFNELQKVKMFIADRNVYGIDLNPVAVELAEVSLWLNTIYEGGFVPWFGTQLVNGNSLIGARRQVYRIENAQSTSKGLRWYEMEPDRVPLGTKRMPKKQVYHFLLGDPGMCSYSDKVIKQLEPANIKEMKDWNKKFTSPFTDDEVVTLLRLSAAIDELWEAQIQLRKEVGTKTQDALSIFGYTDDAEDSHTTIRQKDKIFSELYKSEHMRNAGPYARLKFAMDYWCALWFWPIDKADLLPTRSEFLFDMSLILEGTTKSVLVTDVVNDKKNIHGQISMFPTEMQKIEAEILDLYSDIGEVDIPALRKQNPRLDLAARIAEQNKFMHWELEFADLFAERGGFDLIVGNPPWIKITWNEQSVLSDRQPMFAVKKLSASETAKYRTETLQVADIRQLYFAEFEEMSGEQNFLNAVQNYADLKGQQTNLFKCFLPQAWMYNAKCGVSAFIHPEGVYDDPKGGALMVSFDTISNLYDAKSIVECFEGDSTLPVPGIKDVNGEWNVQGHPARIIHVTKKELAVFAKLFDGSDNWKQAKLPVLHTRDLVSVLSRFAEQEYTLANISEHISVTQMWDETNAQKNGIISRNVRFPEKMIDTIYSGPHIFVANPLFKTSRRVCKLNSDYDNIDLTALPNNYTQRTNYEPCDAKNYAMAVPETSWGAKCNDEYRILFRRMLNLGGERTLIGAIVPPHSGHISTMISISFQDLQDEIMVAGLLFSLPYDAFIKILGKGDMYYDTIVRFPFLRNSLPELEVRVLLLNALNGNYANLWRKLWKNQYCEQEWSKKDVRLPSDTFSKLTVSWNENFPIYSDYGRRQLMIEIDVLVARLLGITLAQLKSIYEIQFPIMQQYEADTWYDANGRITFTNNRSLVGVGFDRKEFELNMKDAPAGKKFYRTIMDDTMPGGPVERTIEYVAPFDRCDREQDYETAWKFFEEKYGRM
ncbi:Eco57I restriction-modification methylase domain-containing protein [Clostridium fessum]|uniref:Eco57I restriction-modification methylase domain-containing protein n=1 Tax=Clostridium fessum TaxID=2126740 RepID=UPI002943DD0E|nr:N-6 DNA methylase [Clostridium fessum]